MNSNPFTAYRLPLTMHLPFTVYGEWITDNVWKTVNSEWKMGVQI